MKYIRIFICVGAGLLLPLTRINLGAEKFSLFALESEIEPPLVRSIARLIVRFITPLLSLLYASLFLSFAALLESRGPRLGFQVLMIWSLIAGYAQWYRHQYGDKEQPYFTMGYSYPLHWIGNKIVCGIDWKNEHLTNGVEVGFWFIMGCVFVYFNQMCFGIMLIVSSCSLGILALNHYALLSENERSIKRHEQTDQWLNPKPEMRLQHKEKDEDVGDYISSPIF